MLELIREPPELVRFVLFCICRLWSQLWATTTTANGVMLPAWISRKVYGCWLPHCLPKEWYSTVYYSLLRYRCLSTGVLLPKSFSSVILCMIMHPSVWCKLNKHLFYYTVLQITFTMKIVILVIHYVFLQISMLLPWLPYMPQASLVENKHSVIHDYNIKSYATYLC